MAVPNEGTTALPSDAGSNFFWGLWDGSNFYAPRADNSTAKNLRVSWYDASGNALGTATNPLGVRMSNGAAFISVPTSSQLPAALGQTTMAASLPVVIASDQSALAVTATGAYTPSDGTQANPTTLVGTQAFLVGWNDVTLTWDRIKAEGVSADGDNAPTAGVLSTEAYLVAYNGATVDRVRTVPGDTGTLAASAKDLTASGTLNALNAAVAITPQGRAGVGFQLATGLYATIVAEFSYDAGLTFVSGLFDDPVTGVTSSSIVVSGNAVSQTILANGGATYVRVRVSSYTSGSASATITATNVSDDPAELYTAPKSKTAPLLTVQVGGVGPDGTIQPLQLSNRNDGALAVAVDVGSLLSEVKAMREAIEALVEILSEE